MKQPDALACRGARFAALLAYTRTTLCDLANAYGDEAVITGLVQAGDYVRALLAEATVHGDLRADLDHLDIQERANFLDEVEAPALLWLASVGYMPATLEHLRLLVYRMQRLTEDSPNYVGAIEQQLAAAEAADRARRVVEASILLHR